jgi:hypothetical protein
MFKKSVILSHFTLSKPYDRLTVPIDYCYIWKLNLVPLSISHAFIRPSWMSSIMDPASNNKANVSIRFDYCKAGPIFHDMGVSVTSAAKRCGVRWWTKWAFVTQLLMLSQYDPSLRHYLRMVSPFFFAGM